MAGRSRRRGEIGAPEGRASSMTQVTSQVLPVWRLLRDEPGQFAVPWHQRYYDWNAEQVGELLHDVNEAVIARRQCYFLGSIMLVEGEDAWEINDGQQRLITISLILASFCRRFTDGGEQPDRGRELQAMRLLFVLPGNTLTVLQESGGHQLRIEPPRYDRSRFASVVRGHDIGANGKLTTAWHSVENFVGGMNAKRREQFFDFLINSVEVGVLYVPPTEDTNAVFEALNGRGKTLDHLDLIRNHLYSYFASPDSAEYRRTVHDSLERVIAICRSSKKAEDYFRCFLQGQFGFLPKTRFYRAARAEIRTRARSGGRDYVYGLVRELSEHSVVELYRNIAASTPDEDFVNLFLGSSRTHGAKRNLETYLAELRGYRVAHPIAFALLRKFVLARDEDSKRRRIIAQKINQCLSDLTSFIMRITFCLSKFEPSRYEANFAKCAKRITDTHAVVDLSILANLREYDELGIMDNDHFRSLLTNKRVTSSTSATRAKRLLFGINAQQQADAGALNFKACTVEHILPQSPMHREGWTGFSRVGGDFGEWVQQIGNLTLLAEGDRYSSVGFNRDFAAKKSVFERSIFNITRDVAHYDDWTPQAISARSRRLAVVASQVWSFSREPVLPGNDREIRRSPGATGRR